MRSWLLDRMETRDLWFDENGQPTILTLARLTDALSRDEDFVSVAKLYAPRKELAKVVAELITDEHVPFLSALRYKPTGLKKRADWEEVWDLQRKEDAAPDEPAKRKIRDSIPVPPKYTSADFLRPSYWRARGKLDVPKERFISYGQTNAATPELYGWARLGPQGASAGPRQLLHQHRAVHRGDHALPRRSAGTPAVAVPVAQRVRHELQRLPGGLLRRIPPAEAGRARTHRRRPSWLAPSGSDPRSSRSSEAVVRSKSRSVGPGAPGV